MQEALLAMAREAQAAGKEVKFVTYEPKRELCKVCGKRDAMLLPLCEIDGKLSTYPVCNECRDKVPYKVIPVVTRLVEGFYFDGKEWHGSMNPVEPQPADPKKGIITRFGKKLLEQNKGETT